MKSREPIAVLLVAILSVAFFAPTIFGGRYFYQRDVGYFFQPQTATVNRIIQSGELPLWNPYGYMGMPLLATWQSRVFSALSLPFYFFGSVGGMRVFYPAIMFLAGFFALAFLRVEGLSPFAATSGATVWMLGGWFVTKLEFFSYASAAAFSFAPLVFVGASWVVAASALALAFLCGYPVFFLIVLLYLTICALRGKIKNATAALAVCSMLCALQALPTAELVLNSQRYRDRKKPDETSLSHSARIKDLAGFFAPAVYPDGGEGSPRYHWLKTFYAGYAGGALALLGLFALIRRKEFFWPLTGLAGIVLAFSAPYDLLRRIFAPAALLRYPSTMIFFSAAGVAAVAAAGSDFLMSRRGKYAYAGVILTVLIFAELFARGMFYQQTAPADFFYETPAAVAVIGKDGAMTRLAIAPKTIKLNAVSGRTAIAAWRGARAALKGFVAWPYGVLNAYGSGEPLVPASADNAIHRAYSMSSPDDAAPALKSLGAGYILSAYKFASSRRYYPVRTSVSPPYLYRLKDPGALFVFEAAGTDKARVFKPSRFSENKISFDFGEDLPRGRLTHVENHYPSWRAYADGKEISVERTPDGFKAVNIPSGIRSLHLFYSPTLFVTGAFVSLVAIASLILVLFRKTDSVLNL
ncbi:MAG: hypothetical protein QME32_02440 [Endomicrobiia bacterium]|nr:hypothetical protein [Endomicrobiia bacterium]